MDRLDLPGWSAGWRVAAPTSACLLSRRSRSSTEVVLRGWESGCGCVAAAPAAARESLNSYSIFKGQRCTRELRRRNLLSMITLARQGRFPRECLAVKPLFSPAYRNLQAVNGSCYAPTSAPSPQPYKTWFSTTAPRPSQWLIRVPLPTRASRSSRGRPAKREPLTCSRSTTPTAIGAAASRKLAVLESGSAAVAGRSPFAVRQPRRSKHS